MPVKGTLFFFTPLESPTRVQARLSRKTYQHLTAFLTGFAGQPQLGNRVSKTLTFRNRGFYIGVPAHDQELFEPPLCILDMCFIDTGKIFYGNDKFVIRNQAGLYGAGIVITVPYGHRPGNQLLYIDNAYKDLVYR